VVAFGGGTSIEGQTLFMNPGSNVSVSLDFNRMTSVIEFNEDYLDITVQPGLGSIY
jgi:FAD/FMN-containing dehydrogenase